MNRSTLWIAAAVLILTTGGCRHLGRRPLKARAESIITLYTNERFPPSRMEKAVAVFDAEELKPGRLSSYDTRTLALVFEALHLADGMLDREDLLPIMEAIFDEALENRSYLGDMHENLLTAYVQHREWTKARALQDRFGLDDDPLPKIVEDVIPSGPAVYDVSGDGRTMTLRPVSLSSGPMIVSVVSPGCHFSQNAVKAITADPELARAFSGNAVNVFPARWHVAAEDIAKENRTGGFRYVILHKPEPWPGVDFGGTPHFYFFQNGKIVHKLEGWGADAAKNLQELRTGLEMIMGGGKQ